MIRATRPGRWPRHARQLGFVGLGLGLGVGLQQAGTPREAACDTTAALEYAAVGLVMGAGAAAIAAHSMQPAAAAAGTSTIVDAVGNTPLLELKALSAATGRRILAKAEYMNPGGSIKVSPCSQYRLSL